MAKGKGGAGRGGQGGGPRDGERARDARRAANPKGGKAARDARRAEGGRKGNTPVDRDRPDHRGEGWWGDRRGADYWKARKAGTADGSGGRGRQGGGDPAGGPSGRGGGRSRTGRDGRSGPGGRPTRAGSDGGARERQAAEAPPLPRGMPHDGQLLYGRNAVHECLLAGRRDVLAVWATDRAVEGEGWLSGEDARLARPDELEALAGSPDHQGVVAAVGPYPYVDLEDLLAGDGPFVVALDEVQDPQNLGSIARTAECAGASGLVLCRHRAAEVTPAAVKASAGATEHLRIAQVRNLADALGEARSAGAWVYGAAGRDDGAVAYTDPDYSGGVVLVLGAEGTGLRPRVAGACDQLVALPLRGRLDSLNVGAAAAALMYAILQTRDRLDGAT